MTLTGTPPPPRPMEIPWQQIANFLFAALIAAGAYVWNDTVADLQHEQIVNQAQDRDIVRLQTERGEQDRTNHRLEAQLEEMNKKLDRLLEQRADGRPSFSSRGSFDK